MCASEQVPPKIAGFRESFNTYLEPVSADDPPRRRNTGPTGSLPGGIVRQLLKGQTMTSKLTLSALALLVAAPAFANATQLERSASVEPGLYTVAQAGEIASSETVADAARLRAFYADTNAGDVSRNAVVSSLAADEAVRNGGSDRH